MTTWNKLQSSKGMESQQDWAVRKPVEHLFLLVIGMGGPSTLRVVPPWAGSPEFYKKSGGASKPGGANM